MMPLPVDEPEDAEEPSAISSITGSTTGSFKLPANAVVAASVNAAASTIDFITKILQIKKLAAYCGKGRWPHDEHPRLYLVKLFNQLRLAIATITCLNPTKLKQKVVK